MASNISTWHYIPRRKITFLHCLYQCSSKGHLEEDISYTLHCTLKLVAFSVIRQYFLNVNCALGNTQGNEIPGSLQEFMSAH